MRRTAFTRSSQFGAGKATILDQAISLGTNSIVTYYAYYARGRAHELRGTRDAAIADYGKALSQDAQDDEYGKFVQSQARARLQALGVPINATKPAEK
jgi:hypothetical protein